MSDPFEFINPRTWGQAENQMWLDTFSDMGGTEDPILTTMFHESYFNFDLPSDQINGFREAFDAYMYDTYGVDFDRIFDWEAYRDAYGDR